MPGSKKISHGKFSDKHRARTYLHCLVLKNDSSVQSLGDTSFPKRKDKFVRDINVSIAPPTRVGY